jgi:hypothetical protein
LCDFRYVTRVLFLGAVPLVNDIHVADSRTC